MKERNFHTENLYQEFYYDTDLDEWGSLGFSTPDIEGVIINSNCSENYLMKNEFWGFREFEDMNYFKDSYGESI